MGASARAHLPAEEAAPQAAATGEAMRYTWLLLALAACTSATDPAAASLRASGTWEVFLRLDGRERPSGGAWVALRCEGGIMTVLDDLDGTINGGFTKGTLACWFGADANPRAVEWASPITGFHELATDSLTLDDGACEYQGQLTDAHHMAGTVHCDRDSGSTELDMEGTWQATK
jgi:hypothetical protein